MKKFLIISGVFLLIVIGILAYVRLFYTKSFSPEGIATFKEGNVHIEVLYNRPYKKGREIFGELVPYDVVWRTGANEATIFKSNNDLFINGQTLLAGDYSLWTIPNEQQWTVIFNSEVGQWGVDFNGVANRNAANDMLTVEVAPLKHDKVFEQFTISIEQVGEELELILLWDQTVIVVPMLVAGS
ncbi:MAG: DUF2911 domain-containing protein [Cyclobacteriaceae bacterium]